VKNLFKVFILTVGLVFCFGVKSFANVSFSVWGGVPWFKYYIYDDGPRDKLGY